MIYLGQAITALAKEFQKRHELVVRGKKLSEMMGHPNWKNTCASCGEVEIPIDKVNCIACKFKEMNKVRFELKFDVSAEEIKRKLNTGVK